MFDSELSPAAHKLAALLSQLDPNQERSLNELATLGGKGLTRSTVQSASKELEAAGILVKDDCIKLDGGYRSAKNQRHFYRLVAVEGQGAVEFGHPPYKDSTCDRANITTKISTRPTTSSTSNGLCKEPVENQHPRPKARQNGSAEHRRAFRYPTPNPRTTTRVDRQEAKRAAMAEEEARSQQQPDRQAPTEAEPTEPVGRPPQELSRSNAKLAALRQAVNERKEAAEQRETQRLARSALRSRRSGGAR